MPVSKDGEMDLPGQAKGEQICPFSVFFTIRPAKYWVMSTSIGEGNLYSKDRFKCFSLPETYIHTQKLCFTSSQGVP